MIILGIILFGMLVGGAAHLLIRDGSPNSWGDDLIAGLIGSFVGGFLLSLISGDGFSLRPSGVIGSIIGAVIVLLAIRWWRRRKAPAPPAKGKSGKPGPTNKGGKSNAKKR